MPGIAPDLYKRLKESLSKCKQFDSDERLADFFIQEPLSAWRDRLPKTSDRNDRLERTIAYLFKQSSSEGKNALILLLRALSVDTPEGDALRGKLTELANDLEELPATESRHALIIAIDKYEDAGLQQLIAPAQDAQDLKRVLGDSAIGNFRVRDILNQPAQNVRCEIEDFFCSGRRSDDLLLFYFSGHGITESGDLFLATTDTKRKLIRATAVAATWLKDVMNASPSCCQVVILDSCYSGAFPQGRTPKGGENLDFSRYFGEQEQGRVILTASGATQHALQEDQIISRGKYGRSLFTHFLVQGLEKGEADRDGDGQISLTELYQYVYDKVVTATQHQQMPQMLPPRPGKKIYIAKSLRVSPPSPPSSSPPPSSIDEFQWQKLPIDLREAILSSIYHRLGAVHQLASLLVGSDIELANTAREALKYLAEDNDRRVFTVAADILAKHDAKERQVKLAALYEQAKKSVQDQNWSEAREALGELVRQDAGFRDAAQLLQGVEKQIRLNGSYVQAKAAIDAGNWLEAQAALGELVAEDAEFGDAASLRQMVTKQVRLADLYAQAEAATKNRDWPKTLTVLGELTKEDADYKDAVEKLTMAKRRVQVSELYKKAGQAHQSHQWQAALNILDQVKVIDPAYDPEGLRLSAVYNCALEVINSRYCADPLLKWEGQFPYGVFSKAKVFPTSSMKAVNDASYAIGMSTEGRMAFDQLRAVDRRLFVDAFLYPLARWEYCVQVLKEALDEKRALSIEQLDSELGEDAPVILLMMGEREPAAVMWEQAQLAHPANSSLAFRLGLLYYWSAKDTASRGDSLLAQARWQRAMGNWAIALTDDDFWKHWGQERSEGYGIQVTQDHLRELQQRVESHFFKELAAYPELTLVLQNELAAVRMLRKAGGLPVPEKQNQKIACGPLMLSVLKVGATFAEFVSRHSAEPTDLVEKLKRLNTRRDWSPRDLRRRFSQLARAVTLLDRSQSAEALAALSEARCGQCPPCDNPDCPLHHGQEGHPKVCCPDCPQFDPLNPAYAQLPNKGRVLFEDAMDISIMAHMRLAEGCIARKEIDLDEARKRWSQAILLGRTIGSQESVQDAIRNTALGRIQFIAKTADQDAEDITWCNQSIEIAEIAMQVAGSNPDLSAILSKALTFRGVREADWFDIVSAEKDLRRAFEFDPAAVHTRHQFAIALTLLAVQRREMGGDRWTAMQLLQEAENIVQEGLVDHPDHSGLKNQLEEIIAQQNPEEPSLSKPVKPMRPLVDELGEILGEFSDTTTSESASGEDEGKIDFLADSFKRKTTIENLEKDWRQDPASKQKRDRLIDAVIEHSEQLVDREQYTEAAQEIEKWQTQFPDENKLHQQANFAREGYKAEKYLRQTDLKFMPDLWEEHAFNLSFHSEIARDVVVRLCVEGDLAIIASRLPSVANVEQGLVFFNLLRATHTVPIHKFCLARPGEPSIVAEIPVSLLRPDLLERTLRLTSDYVDIALETLSSLERLKEHFETQRVPRAILNPIEWLEERLTADLIPSLCGKQNIECKPLSDGRFSIRFGRIGREIISSYTNTAVHLAVTAGPLKERREPFYRRMAEINAAMRVCKAVLDPDQNVVFMCELPGLDEPSLVRAIESLEKYTASFSAELVG